MKDSDIDSVLNISRINRYEATSIGFEIIDMMEYLDLSKKIQRLKPAIRAIHLIDKKSVQWDYITEEQRNKLREEIGLEQERDAHKIFGTNPLDDITNLQGPVGIDAEMAEVDKEIDAEDSDEKT